jgi:hypothetical protein
VFPWGFRLPRFCRARIDMRNIREISLLPLMATGSNLTVLENLVRRGLDRPTWAGKEMTKPMGCTPCGINHLAFAEESGVRLFATVSAYARQRSMVAQLDEGSIPSGSTKLHSISMSEGCVHKYERAQRRYQRRPGENPAAIECNTAGPIWFRQVTRW